MSHGNDQHDHVEKPPARTTALIVDRSPTGEVAIPPNILVACPMKQFKHRPAAKCDGCPHFLGLGDNARGKDDVRFEYRYTVICKHPITRALSRFDLADD